MSLIVLILIIVLYLLANFYIFHHIWIAMPPTAVGQVILVSFAVVAVASFVVSFMFGDSLPLWLSSVLYKIGTGWFFISIYFLLVMIVKDLFGLANNFLHFMPSDAITRYTKDNWVGFAFMVGFIALLMLCGFLKYQWKVRVDLPIQLTKTMGDSIQSKPLRIVAMSDLHLGYAIGKKEFDEWVAIINKENPDIVLIAGDIIDNSVRPLNEENFAESFKKIKAPLGVYMCLGNHEYISGLKESLEFLDKTGVQVLRDESILIDSSFYLVGRDDRINSKRKTLKDLVEGLDKTKPIFVLDHQPYNLEEAEINGVDIQLSGHTHQGQIWPISLVTGMLYEVDHGFLKKGNSNIYVSSGIGLWGGKFRIGTQSEYIVIDINR